MSAFRSPLYAALGLLCGGCFLEELRVSCVDSQKDCHALNVANTIDDNAGAACRVYQCREDGRGCELRPRDYDEDGSPDAESCGDELEGRLDCDDEPGSGEAFHPDAPENCDEHDNDCDGWIDEGMLSEDTLEAQKVTPLQDVSEQADLKLSMLRGDAPWLALTARTGDQVMTRLLAPRIPELAALTQDKSPSCDDECKMSEVAVASSEELLLAVGIHTLGCRAGQLRVGVADGASAGAAEDASVSVADGAGTKRLTRKLTWDGVCRACEDGTLPAPTSNLSLGVDRGGERSCSVSGEAAGASAPSVGLLRNERGQAQGALALWRAGPANGGALPLVGLPLRFVRSIRNQGRVVSVQGAQSASSHAFDEAGTEGSEPALIQPWRGSRQSGYLVAYDSAQGVELAFVPAAVSPAFSEIYRLSIPARGGARSVALAFMAPDQETAPPGGEIALAWRSQADGGDDLLLARVRFDPAADPPLTLLSCGRLYEPRELLEGPTLLYHAPGFAEESAARGGGFFLTWVEQDRALRRLMGARLDEAAAATDTSCRKSVSRALTEEPFPLEGSVGVAHPFTFAGADQLPRYAFFTQGAEPRLNIGSLRCQSE